MTKPYYLDGHTPEEVVARAFSGDGKWAVAALIEAGVPEARLLSESQRAVRIAQRLPKTVGAYRTLARKAKAARKGIAAIEAFYDELHDGPEGMYRPALERDPILEQLDEWDDFIARWETVDLVELGVHPQTDTGSHWTAIRVGVGKMSAWFTLLAQGFPNDERVATLAMALFDRTIIADDVRRWRRSIESLPGPELDRFNA